MKFSTLFSAMTLLPEQQAKYLACKDISPQRPLKLILADL